MPGSTAESKPPGPSPDPAAFPYGPCTSYLQLLPKELREKLWSELYESMWDVRFWDEYSFVRYMDMYWDVVVDLLD